MPRFAVGRKNDLVLLGLTALTVLFGYLAYDEILFFISGWRWGRNGFVLFKTGWRAMLLVLLTLGAAVGPVAYCLLKLGWIRSDPGRKKIPNRYAE